MTEKLKIKQNGRPEKISYGDWDTLNLEEVLEKFSKVFEILEPPITVGLYGSWGSGKTEMIRALDENLQNQKYATLIFDAWKYRKEEHIIFPVISALAEEYKKEKTDGIKASSKRIIKTASFFY